MSRTLDRKDNWSVCGSIIAGATRLAGAGFWMSYASNMVKRVAHYYFKRAADRKAELPVHAFVRAKTSAAPHECPLTTAARMGKIAVMARMLPHFNLPALSDMAGIFFLELMIHNRNPRCVQHLLK